MFPSHDPGFETGDLTGWTVTGSGTIDNSPVRTGSWSYNTTANTNYISQTITLRAGTKYRLSGWVYQTAIDNSYIYAKDFPSGAAYESQAINNVQQDAWYYMELIFDVGSADVAVEVGMGQYSNGSVNWDDMSLVELKEHRS